METGSAWCSHGARVDPRPEEASLLQSLCCSVSTVYNMGDSEPPDILCESCACIIHTNLQSCMSTPRPSHLKRASEIPSYQLLGA